MADALPLDSYYEVTAASDVALSPDGERAAFVAGEFDGADDRRRSSVFVVPTDGSADPYRLARASDASAPAWSPDGSKLAILAAREEDLARSVGPPDEDDEADGSAVGSDGEDDDATDEEDTGGEEDAEGTGGEGPRTQVWVWDMERGGDARQVTDREEGVEAFDWGPDGERIVFASRDPTDEEAEYLRRRRDEDGPVEVERLQHKFDGQGFLDAVTTYLFVTGVEGGTIGSDADGDDDPVRLDDAYARGAGAVQGGMQPAWSPDGDRIAFRSYRGEDPDDTYRQDCYLIDPDGDGLERLTDGEISASSFEWSPDGDRLAFVGRDHENWYLPSELYVADPQAGTYVSRSASLDRRFGYGGAPQWLDDDRLVGLIADEARTRVCLFDADRDDPERAFRRQADDETLTTYDVENDTVVVIASSPGGGTDLYAMSVEDLRAGAEDPDPRRRLTAVNDDLLDRYDQPDVHRFEFERDGTVEGLAVTPPDFDPDDPDPRPTILSIHGGPMAHDQPAWRFTDGVFTTRGYIVARINYRGSTSYGREFCEALRGEWNGPEVEDLLAGVEALVDRGWADPDRLFCTGFSQGGVNTAYCLTRDDPFAAAAAEHGIYDARSCFGTDDSQNWWENDFGLPWEEPENYDRISSITDVGEIDTPLLVTAGENDWRCPPSQAEQLYVSVRKQGIDAKLVVYPDEHHDVGDPDRAIHRLETLTDWFAAHDPERDTDGGE